MTWHLNLVKLAIISTLFIPGCEMKKEIIDLNSKKEEIIKNISVSSGIDTNFDFCSSLKKKDGKSFSCFFSRKENLASFNILFNILKSIGYQPKSAIRNDYGIWSAILTDKDVDVVLRSESIKNVNEGIYLKYKKSGFSTILNITVYNTD